MTLKRNKYSELAKMVKEEIKKSKELTNRKMEEKEEKEVKKGMEKEKEVKHIEDYKILEKIKELEEKIKPIEEMNKKYEELMEKIAMLYEIAMNNMNPFVAGTIEMKENPGGEEINEIKKKVKNKEEGEEIIPKKPKKVEIEEKRVEKVVLQKEKPTSKPKPLKPLEKPKIILKEIDHTDPDVIEKIIEWLSFIMEKVGQKGLEDALGYYEEIGWISRDIAKLMLLYSQGLGIDNKKTTGKLSPKDHITSLNYIKEIKEIMERKKEIYGE